ncbi:hypothetical protein BU24DRAFT_142999 [Aaosphaeria arxii CBS 175.79]|uniref:Uncharacterized protein n=1 Tax=Aaosphaeria arxii CBS 175.79 TaxID=1450172 RepID=A0A6A5XUS6_9PLEO|nr:uncharacterized protein BU24DRAFT_142999 [Aaosphaeria arxii CBS 175.79]KAF2017068.1 hypothetical protein BU24DRAFT_142999 [Aaosphaeria arxii CBS 175.79]
MWCGISVHPVGTAHTLAGGLAGWLDLLAAQPALLRDDADANRSSELNLIYYLPHLSSNAHAHTIHIPSKRDRAHTPHPAHARPHGCRIEVGIRNRFTHIHYSHALRRIERSALKRPLEPRSLHTAAMMV